VGVDDHTRPDVTGSGRTFLERPNKQGFGGRPRGNLSTKTKTVFERGGGEKKALGETLNIRFTERIRRWRPEIGKSGQDNTKETRK